jgi:hypothetical protein
VVATDPERLDQPDVIDGSVTRPSGPRRRSVLADRLVAACCLTWAFPTVVSLGRALARDWYPVADQALIAVGARDAMTGHHRWIGTVASLSVRHTLASHPGPLQFDLVALPVRLFGSGWGLALGVALVNLGAGLVAIIAAARQAGRGGAVATTVGLLLLVWSAGNQVIIEPYNPTAAMVPYFAVLILAWAVVNGDRWALPWLVGWGSLCAQANIAYVLTTLPIVVGAIAFYLWRRRGQRGGRDVLLRCAPVALVLWAQPIAEQIGRGSDGNMERILRNADNLQQPLGLADGTRRAAVVLSMWPGWGRGNFDGGYTELFQQLPSLGWSAFTLLAVVTVLGAAAYASGRWLRDPILRTLLVAAAVFVVLGWAGTVRVPLSPFFGFLAHLFRWLWPIGAFSAVALGLFLGRAAQRWVGHRVLAVGAVAALMASALMAVPYGPPALDSGVFDGSRPTASALNDLAVERLPDTGVVVDFRASKFSPLTFSLVAALQEHGTPFAVNDPISLRQFDDRRPPADTRWPIVVVVTGFDALNVWNEAAACVSPLDPEERARLLWTRDALSDALSEPGFTLSDVGARFAGTAFAPSWMADVTNGLPHRAGKVVESKDFATLLGTGLIVPLTGVESISAEFLALREGLEQSTACVTER